MAPQWYPVAGGDEFWRIYFRGGAHPLRWNQCRRFGPADARFDHHLNSNGAQCVLYLAKSPVTCIAEIFQKTRTIHRDHHKPALVGFALESPVKLLDLTGAFTTRIGRNWARGLYAAYPEAQGIAYPSSMHANAPAIVLNERAMGALPSSPAFHKALNDAGMITVLKNAARSLGYTLR